MLNGQLLQKLTGYYEKSKEDYPVHCCCKQSYLLNTEDGFTQTDPL